jgi:hypothetical protein
MDRPLQIKEEIKGLKQMIQHLEQELLAIQSGCHHEYQNGPLNKICPLCQHSESLYY